MNSSQIEDRAHAALKVLTDTDELAADLKLEASKAEQRWQKSCDVQFLIGAGNIEERKANARKECDPLYLEYLDAVRAYDALANKRKSETLVVEWCRSIYSAYKQGKM